MKTIVKMNKKRELCWTINNINCQFANDEPKEMSKNMRIQKNEKRKQIPYKILILCL